MDAQFGPHKNAYSASMCEQTICYDSRWSGPGLSIWLSDKSDLYLPFSLRSCLISTSLPTPECKDLTLKGFYWAEVDFSLSSMTACVKRLGAKVWLALNNKYTQS